MQHLKLAIVHNTITPYRHPLFERLSENLDLIVYYCSFKHSFRKWDLWPRNYVYEYRLLPGIQLMASTDEVSFNPSIIKELITNRPDMLILSEYTSPTVWLAFAISKLLKIRLIYWTEGIKEPESFIGISSRPLRTLFAKTCSSIIVPGKLSRNYVISLGADATKVFVAPNVIDNEFFIKTAEEFRLHKEKLKGQLGFRNRTVCFYLGQLTKRKGVEYLLLAYSKLEQECGNTALLIIGSGPEESDLKKLAVALNIKNVQFIGSGLSFKDIVKFFSIADIFVLPTLDDLWGFVINEAMACGLPILATLAAQAAQEMVHHGANGYVVREGDSEVLYTALKDLVSDPVRREQMGNWSVEIAKHNFDVPSMVKGFLCAIQHSIG